MEIKLKLNEGNEAALKGLMERTNISLGDIFIKSLALYDKLTILEKQGGEIWIREHPNSILNRIEIWRF